MKHILGSVTVAALLFLSSRVQAQTTEAAARVSDKAGVFQRVDIERIAFALQDLEQSAKIEARVQAYNDVNDDIPRPLTARDISIVLIPNDGTLNVRVGSELKNVLPDERVQKLVSEISQPAIAQKNYADGIVDLLKQFAKIGAEEGGVKEAKRIETGRDLAKVIAICSAATLLFLWILLFMNSFVGERVPIDPYLLRICLAHIITIVGMIAGYVLELRFGLGIRGMAIIPLIFALQMAILFRVFAKLLPAITRA